MSKSRIYIGRHRSMFVNYLDSNYVARHGAGLDAAVAA